MRSTPFRLLASAAALVVVAATLALGGPAAGGTAGTAPAGGVPEPRDLPDCAGPDGPFPDVSASHLFCAEISWAAGQDITGGYDDGSFRPAAPVSRQAAAAFLRRAIGFPSSPSCEGGPAPFVDVSADHQFCTPIAELTDAGIANGYDDGTFRPAAPVSRMAMAAFLYRLDPTRPAGGRCAGGPTGPFSDVAANHPFCNEITALADEGVLRGYEDGSFRGSATVSRQAMIAFLVRLIDPAPPGHPLKINEIDYDQPGADGAEFIEVLNTGDTAVSLDGVELALINGSGGDTYRSIALPDATLAAGEHYVVCGSATAVANCDHELGQAENLIQNGPDAVSLLVDGSLVDSIAYEGAVPGAGEGDPVPVDQADSSTGPGSLNRCPNGADTDDNATDVIFRIIPTPGGPNACLIA